MMKDIGYGGKCLWVRPAKIIGIKESAMNHVTVYLTGIPNHKVIAKSEAEAQAYIDKVLGIVNGA